MKDSDMRQNIVFPQFCDVDLFFFLRLQVLGELETNGEMNPNIGLLIGDNAL